MSWWMGDLAQSGRYVELLSWIFWVLLSITLHELAHGWAAIRQGDDTPLRYQRMTVNPIVHMGLNSLIVFAFCGIAWGQMPVNRHRFKDGHKGDVYVAAAGPAMNVLIALVCIILLTLWIGIGPQGTNLARNIAIFFYLGVGLNLILAPFNLLPIPPLDGSRILAGISPRVRELYERPQAQLFGLFVFIAIFFMTPIGGLLFEMGWGGAALLIDTVGGLVGNPPIGGAI